MSPPSLLSLPPEVLGLIPMGGDDLKSLALSCRALRDAVARVVCDRPFKIRHENARVLSGRFGDATAVRVVDGGVVSLPPLPRLRSLHLDECRPPSWTALFDAAPRLEELRVSMFLMYHRDFRSHLDSCMDLVTSPGTARLRRLEVTGRGSVMWGDGVLDEDPTFARMRRTDPPPLVELRSLRLTGRQFAPALRAPVLEEACVDEPHGVDDVLARLRAPGLRTLTWNTSLDKSEFPPTFPSLESLTLMIDGLRSEACLRRAFANLATLPSGLTRLSFNPVLIREVESYPFDATPLSHLTRLRELRLEFFVTPPGLGALLTTLLGAPAGLSFVGVRVSASPAAHLYQLRADILSYEDVDPEDCPEVQQLDDDIRDLEADFAIHDSEVDAALRCFPGATFDLVNLEVASRPRVTCTPPEWRKHFSGRDPHPCVSRW